MVKKPENKETAKENRSDLKKIAENNSKKKDANGEKKIILEQENNGVMNEKDVFKPPKDVQLPASVKNKEEINETTISK